MPGIYISRSCNVIYAVIYTHDHDDPNLATRTALATFILSDLNLNLPLVSTRSLSISISSPLSRPICTHIRTRITSNLLLLVSLLHRPAIWNLKSMTAMKVAAALSTFAAIVNAHAGLTFPPPRNNFGNKDPSVRNHSADSFHNNGAFCTGDECLWFNEGCWIGCPINCSSRMPANNPKAKGYAKSQEFTYNTYVVAALSLHAGHTGRSRGDSSTRRTAPR